ncbi:cyclic pyranopterin monophosphate synthase MoaC [Hydrogenivirga sp. 128-5-R1-1]|uniref:cyclic pyranopterin monophosphate synthase MoaC n=1 Tax=Hydrogenivirga sp. 128-5-R1-1 TaxID=392423 RepID=UPI00015F0C5C|nr:cyclic pyranopterin monophosphate synthase MoaC [Hydrogenivirga sp. 128-5-R1-1]EDP75775.1 molybdenum cofactor biosynthesis moaC [Hydrogenivirga sp. 128-5-R1-1]
MRTIDVSPKFETHRSARAYGRIRLRPETVELIRGKKLPKGDLVEATKLTGIYGAKRTGEILPFCHPISLDFVEVEVRVNDNSVEVFSTVSGIARTGYEMEALTAVSTALLNVYDMCKGVDDEMVIEDIRLTDKKGGKSDWSVKLEGVGVRVLSQNEELKDVALSYLKDLGAVESEKPRLTVVLGEPTGLKEELISLEAVIALYDFRKNPTLVGEEIRVGRNGEGSLVVVIPPRKEKLKLFFETFGGILGSLL